MRAETGTSRFPVGTGIALSLPANANNLLALTLEIARSNI
jgi:hypothetical protein